MQEQPAQQPRKKPSAVFEMPDLTTAGQTLSAAERDFFVANGFVVKRGLIGQDALTDAMDRVWAHLLDRVPIDQRSPWALVRHNPETWLNPRWAPMPPVPRAGSYEGRQRIVHAGATVKLHDLGGASFLLDLLPNNPSVRHVAIALLGDLRPSRRTRGVYALFPTSTPASASGDEEARIVRALGPHTDQVCQQLNACAYLEDVPARSGGFTVYPGSHRIMFRAHRYAANWSPLPTFRAAMRQVVAEIEPLELVGNAGDVIFWHGRTVHSAGAHLGSGIRWALFADFTHNRETLTDDEHRQAGLYEWFKDTKLFRSDSEAGQDMWQGWQLGG